MFFIPPSAPEKSLQRILASPGVYLKHISSAGSLLAALGHVPEGGREVCGISSPQPGGEMSTWCPFLPQCFRGRVASQGAPVPPEDPAVSTEPLWPIMLPLWEQSQPHPGHPLGALTVRPAGTQIQIQLVSLTSGSESHTSVCLPCHHRGQKLVR